MSAIILETCARTRASEAIERIIFFELRQIEHGLGNLFVEDGFTRPIHRAP